MAECPKVGVLYSYMRCDEKWIFAALDERKVDYDRLNDQSIIFNLDHKKRWQKYDVILIRSISYARGLYSARVLNSWGVPTVNTAAVAEVCGNKLTTDTVLFQAGVPQPRTMIAHTPESALNAIEKMGYPVVIKPPVGSWGRRLAKINDFDAAESILEYKSKSASNGNSVFYIQKYINKPGRDIRVFTIGGELVAAIYRKSSHWVTNTARGGEVEVCPVTPELTKICQDASRAVGGGVLGMDVIEHPERGYIINEINHTMEFHTTVPVTGVDIPNLIIDYVLAVGSENAE
ncbi:MAG: lysine biosynthesis protein LysX [Chloroflexota bacterium]|nr:lysine biosynthesis protein LysX [Chloroflexota bacterium]